MSRARPLLRSIALALLFAFAVGVGIGTWLRCELERSPTFIG